ncbi:uncharacterized protein LOC124865439 isoform X2 [Girardinichthys multiradiatus]|uniref:uncharacterized protein LOC124865439 isoform X2 n=1 Tax=Girardinichthys multiradiatus TaxID=208333 RepID=UPI001FAB47D1|nr:uncharacterized protein LOC124865439 isoform X2 [Girardinichthys multiradiatus]
MAEDPRRQAGSNVAWITMTLTREAHCLICYKVSAAMSDYMRKSHFINDLQERRMLLNFSSGHVNEHNSPGCTYKTGCLDQHKQFAHPDLSADLRESYMQSDRKAKTVSMLQDLRKTEPSLPMVSGLDNDDKGNAIIFRRVSRNPRRAQATRTSGPPETP